MSGTWSVLYKAKSRLAILFVLPIPSQAHSHTSLPCSGLSVADHSRQRSSDSPLFLLVGCARGLESSRRQSLEDYSSLTLPLS